jgi:hypothetical protein
MNAVRPIALGAAGHVVVASMIPLAPSAPTCEIVVDSYTGSATCLDLPQPATGFSIAWLWIGLAVVLAVTAVVLLGRRRPLKRVPVPATLKAHVEESNGLQATKHVQIPRPRTAEADSQRGPVAPEKLPSSR